MNCPKCKSKIGLQYMERTIRSWHDTTGMSCLICGYWIGFNVNHPQK